MDLVFLDERRGYLSLGEGRLEEFSLPDDAGGELRLETVAEGLDFPRGMAILEDELFVAELDPLPCEPSFPSCTGPEVDATSPEDGEMEIIRASRGRIVAYRIDADGSLSDQREVVADLPVVATDHGINGLATGPDGMLYVAVGSLGSLWSRPEVIDEVDHPNSEWLGTILRVAPDGDHTEVFASGLRNVYGLAFDDEGSLYGVDNDGFTVTGL